MDLARQDEARAIVRATVDLARSLSMRVTAEGVETVQQLQAVRTLGCTEIQGYLLSPPRPAAEALQLLPSPGEEVDYPLHQSVGGQKYTKVCRARPDLECNHRLTERECDVLEGILAGHSSEESAGHLNVKPAFIEDYRERIKQKIGANDTSAIIRTLMTAGCSRLPSAPTLRSSQLVEINTATDSDTTLTRVGPNRTVGRRA